MESVGVRELKNRLSHYLNTVRQGKNIVVTVRGKPVARLMPLSPPGRSGLSSELEERMWELATDRLLAWSGQPPQVPPEPTAVNRGPELLSDLVVEDRE